MRANRRGISFKARECLPRDDEHIVLLTVEWKILLDRLLPVAIVYPVFCYEARIINQPKKPSRYIRIKSLNLPQIPRLQRHITSLSIRTLRAERFIIASISPSAT